MCPLRWMLLMLSWGHQLHVFSLHLLWDPHAGYEGSQPHAQVVSSTMKPPAIRGFSCRVFLKQGSTPGCSRGCQPTARDAPGRCRVQWGLMAGAEHLSF